jgi:hypothetical protein
LIVIILILSADGYGQKRKLQRYDTDLYISAVSFNRDLGPAGESILNNFSGFRPYVGFRTGFRITKDLVVTMHLGYIMYGGKLEENAGYMNNYSFNSAAFQHTLRMEYFIIGDGRGPKPGAVYNRRGMINTERRFYLFGFAGAGGVLSKYYSSFQYGYVFPMGGGIRFTLSPVWSIGAEFGYQFSTSDLIDGYSREDLSGARDSYYLTCVKAIYKIRNLRRDIPVFAQRY